MITTEIENECSCGKGWGKRYKYTYDTINKKVTCKYCKNVFNYKQMRNGKEVDNF
jgi:hypothetical protein